MVNEKFQNLMPKKLSIIKDELQHFSSLDKLDHLEMKMNDRFDQLIAMVSQKFDAIDVGMPKKQDLFSAQPDRSTVLLKLSYKVITHEVEIQQICRAK
ncbi:hypothetical protein [Heliophilum fasciatum]|uniref:Uncharacterized protein n=1 Tax=Heliophilum fasciatum TaxID=35700 RepID=A0A4R2RCG4_9FIRM|nr:hypothetical protein [Heliophilum fasciatum]MCW2279259.1 hypothetical protein [Heliophilum fasciatum]TCP60493.1 hypothetical protein EDD73_13621 [Heliophilum fasciatum]